MSETMVFRRDVPVRHEVDVLVAGGGPAGITAAVAAARQGAKVFLAEGHTCLGGMATAGLVPAFAMFGDGVNFLAAGLGQEIYDRLFQMGGQWPEVSYEESPTHWVALRVEVLKRLYDDMLVEAGVDFTFQTQVVAVETDGGRVTTAVCAAKSGIFAVKAQVFVDGTGDGDLAAWAGAPFEKGDDEGRLMPGTLCSLWSDVNWQVAHADDALPQSSRIMDAFQDGVLSVEDRHLPGMFRTSKHLGGGNIGHAFGVDGTDERSLTKAFIEQRKRLLEYERYYQEYLKGFEGMELAATGSLMGLRETRRIMGDYVLNVADYEARAVFADEIARYAYPVDIHPAVPSADTYEQFLAEYERKYRYDRGESYGIPYRILTPRGLVNVLVAGRCVSSDRPVQASLRVMPGCFLTGQAAGVAAALAAAHDGDTRAFPIARLQSELKKMGAYLPNC